MKKYYSLRELAVELDIPKSTVVKYKDYFSDFLPTHGEGKRKKYDDTALEILKEVRKLRDDDKLDWLEIKDLLDEKYAHAESQEAPQQIVPATASPMAVQTIAKADTRHLEHMVNVLAGEVIKLAEGVSDVKSAVSRQGNAIQKIEKRVEQTGRNLEAVAAEILRRGNGIDRQELKKLAAGINSEFSALKESVKKLAADSTAGGAKEENKELTAVVKKVEALMSKSGDAAKQQVLAKENEVLKKKLKEMILAQREQQKKAAAAPLPITTVIRETPVVERESHSHSHSDGGRSHHGERAFNEDHRDEYESREKKGGLFSFLKKR